MHPEKSMTTDQGNRRPRAARAQSALLTAAVCLTLSLAACGTEPHGHDHPHGETAAKAAGEGWSITAWGTHFEVFPEVEALVAGETSAAHVHVTRLADFSPLGDGAVEIVLASSAGEQVFSAEASNRPGVFTAQLTPTASADFDLILRIRTDEAREDIRGGRVRVGTAGSPGGLIVAPAPKGGDGGEPLPFLKEEQWRSDFATSWVRRGALARSVVGPTRLRPPAGGETVLSSSIDGIIHPAGDWPYAGRKVDRGMALFHIVPRVAAQQSLAALEAEAASLAIEKTTVLARLTRLRELLELEATSQREVEEVDQLAQILAARHRAAIRDLESARTSRQGGTAGALHIRAPFDGMIAEVSGTPGATVTPGQALARLVRTDTVWLEVALSPGDAARLDSEEVDGILLSRGRQEPVRLEEGVRLVAASPEVSPTSGTLSVILEAPAVEGLALGTVLEGQILLRQVQEGIVIPATALVDDGGVSVVYLQLSGETFVRQEVRLVERQGERLLVEGLEPGQRLVHSGGNSIRRASLMSSGGAHGHVH